MATTLELRFPLGRYHATPWNRGVNEGAAEWPPSPWRLLRALIATWHTRWPDLPAADFDELLDVLGGPPSYWTPRVTPGHTRHYLPNLSYKHGLPDGKEQRPGSQKNDPSGRELTLDPFLWVGRDTELLVRWDAGLSPEQRTVLAKLAELLPYLGRAESVCHARLLDSDPVPDATWWRPDADGPLRTRLLAPARPVSRETLEVTALDVRRQRRTLPPGTMWVSYAAGLGERPIKQQRQPELVTAVRYAVTGAAPLKSTHGVLLADAAHRAAGRLLTSDGCTDDERRAILGSGGAPTNHDHAHWVPIADGDQRGATVHSLVLWVPRGLTAEQVAAIVRPLTLSGRLGGRGDAQGYDVRGFPKVRLLFQSAGKIEQVAPELCGPARRWRSRTPYLPVRHRKRETLSQFLTGDVVTELGYRGREGSSVSPLELDGLVPDRWAREFRRYRLAEHMKQSRPGLGLRLEFADEVRGPLLLGQLSHFGYGIFVPEPG
jgi:CRISPR-associated protein Csb2